MDSFGQVVVKILPFLLAGMIVPSWTKYVILLLGTDRPTMNATAFVLGNATFRLLLGFTAIFVFSVGYVDEQTSNPPGGESTWLIVPGVLLLGLAVYLFRRRPAEDTDELPGWLRRFSNLNPWVAFLAGLVMVALPGVQYVYFLSGTGVIEKNSEGPLAAFLWLLLFVFLLQLMLLVPIIIFKATGKRGEEMMQKAKSWLGKHESQVVGAVIFVFGGFLLFLGIQSAMAAG